MKYYELNKEEQEIHDAIDRGEYEVLPDQEKLRLEAMTIAKNSSNKTRNINLRLSERTLFKLKAKAIREGIPYQTLAASILHKNSE